MKNHTLIFKSSFRRDFQEIQEFFRVMIGVEIVADMYLEKIVREIEVIQNPLIKGEIAKFEQTEFRKIPILQGRFLIFFKMKDPCTKEIFYIKPAKTNYQFSIR